MIGRVNSGAGGGGLSPNAAVLAVTAPVGSTITISKSGTSKTQDASKGHTSADDSSVAVWYFSISTANFGIWTVTIEKSGEDPASDTIVIDSAKTYEMLMDYTAWLYKDGNQYTQRTGGWSATAGGSYVEFGSSSINFTNSSQFPIISTENLIPLTNYSTLYVEMLVNSFGGSGNIKIGVANSRITADNQFTASSTINSTGSKTASVDISNYSDSKYIAITGYHANASFLKIWLE